MQCTAQSLREALGDGGFVHVRSSSPGAIVKLMRTRDGLAVKRPDGAFAEFGAGDWDGVAAHVRRALSPPLPSAARAPRQVRLPEDEALDADSRARAAKNMLYDFPDTLCWRGQYPDGTDKPNFGKLHAVNRTRTRTLCGRAVPKVWSYEDSSDEECSACARIRKRLETDAEG